MDAYSLYVNWALYAVYGDMGSADALMRAGGPGIRLVARELRGFRTGFPERLHRGLLLEPERTGPPQAGARRRLEHDQRLTFLSFSEDRDVACWFADRDSICSEHVAAKRPRAVGWLIEHDYEPADVLFHWRWAALLGLAARAKTHPAIDAEQFAWSVQTQREVILEPVAALSATRYATAQHPTTAELDARFAPPALLAERRATCR